MNELWPDLKSPLPDLYMKLFPSLFHFPLHPISLQHFSSSLFSPLLLPLPLYQYATELLCSTIHIYILVNFGCLAVTEALYFITSVSLCR